MSGRRFLTMDATLGVFPIYAKSGRALRVREPRELVGTLEPGETDRFFTTLKTFRDRAIVALMLVCGLRSMEVLELKRDDANALAQTLRVRGKGSKERMIPLPRAVHELLERYIETERPVGPGLEREQTIFLVLKGPRRGLPMSREGLRALFRYKRRISGVAHANPHRFRHTFGRNMAVGGMSLPSLQRMMGHSDHRTTIRYINLSMQDVHADFEKAAENLRRLSAI
jgi:site-specific recombinase XerD